jgi:hypothetical protein
MGVDEYWDFRALNRLSSTHYGPGPGDLRGVREGFFGFGCCGAPVLTHPELAHPLLETVAEALVLVGPETAGAAYL